LETGLKINLLHSFSQLKILYAALNASIPNNLRPGAVLSLLRKRVEENKLLAEASNAVFSDQILML